MKKILQFLARAALGIIVVTGFVACIYFHFQVWRLQHPSAPSWTYFFNN